MISALQMNIPRCADTSVRRPEWVKDVAEAIPGALWVDTEDDVDRAATPTSGVLASGITTGNPSIPAQQLEAETWTSEDEKRFQRLVHEEVQETISKENYRELERLQTRRRQAKSPRSIEEILFDHARAKHLAKIERALGEYVTFMRTAR